MEAIDIDKLEAGPELDALIAEKVMGWEVFELGYYGTEDETPRMRELSDWIDRIGIEAVGRYFIDERTGFWVDADDLQFSTDIAAAWQVLANFNSYELRHNRWLTHDNGKPPHYYAQVSKYKPEAFAWAVASTQELAICRAALKAVMATDLAIRPR